MTRCDLTNVCILIAGGNPEYATSEVRKRWPAARVLAPSEAPLMELLRVHRPTIAFVTKSPEIEKGEWEAIVGSEGLRWLHLGNVGSDHVPASAPRSLSVTNSAGAAAKIMAEYVIGAIMMIGTGLLKSVREQANRRWEAASRREIIGQRLTLIGCGHIGGELLNLASSIGLETTVVRRNGIKPLTAVAQFPPERLLEAVRDADFISIQVPLSVTTKGLVSESVINAIKPSAWLINVARGEIVDEPALVAALKANRIGGAVLDVACTEPLPPTDPLWDLPNVVITPHQSGAHRDYDRITTAIFCNYLEKFVIDGCLPTN